MAITAVTGDIGAGKSTVSKLLAEKLSCERLDADALVSQIWTRSEVKEFFTQRWGSKILDESGNIVKSEISRIIFTDQDEYNFCNKIIHALVMSELKEESERHERLVIEIPLLPEAGRPNWLNYAVYVTADFDLRLQRCMTQRGWDINELLRRERLLLPHDKRIACSDYIISNNGSLADLEEQAALFMKFVGRPYPAPPLIRGRRKTGDKSLMNNNSNSNKSEVPERINIPDNFKWDLEAIYKDFDEWQKAFDDVQAKIEGLKKFAGRLGEGSQTLLEFIRAEEAASLEMNKLYSYANMKSHEDMRESKPMELAGMAESLLVKYSSAVAFFEPEILSLPDDYINECIKKEHELTRYEFFFRKLLREREHILPHDLEILLAKTGELTSVPENAFRLLTDADMKFPDIQDESGNRTELTEERWYRFSRSQNREVRRSAFMGIHGTYDKFRNSIAALYSGSVKGDIFYSQARKYKNSLDMALFGENVPEAVYNHVVDTAREYSPRLMHRLIALRKKILGLDELHFYDINAPLCEEPKGEFAFDDAVELAIKALAPLGEDYVNNFRKGINERWIDIYENKGKRKGAYSWGAYGTKPYVLLNYDGTLHDVFTLVHEMGHSLHSYYSKTNQPQVYADYTILLAEVASTTNEALLLEYLLRNSNSINEKKWLLNYYYDMVRTTFFRQAMFADFERQTHSYSEDGGVLTPDYLCTLWGNLNAQYYGPDMTIDPELCAEWARIPHFYSAFYVYKYVTGFTAANAFASAILNHEENAVSRYLKFLQSGGSDYSLNILRRAGVDLTSPEPFERTMKFFEARLNEGASLWEK